MSGSLRTFTYTLDGGVNANVLVDESNAKGVATPGGALFPAVASANPELPRGTRMRYVNAFNVALPVQKRRFWVATAATLALMATGAVILADGVSWRVTSSRGERRRILPLGDTGQDDGTPGNT